MTAPEMILFDYGGTLIAEPTFDKKRGNAALFRYIKDNPDNITVDEFTEYFSKLFEEIRELRGDCIEIHEYHLLRYVTEHFRLTLTAPFEEVEAAIADAITEVAMTPGADDMLGLLREKGIRTGVISNLCWSEKVLKERLGRFFPGHRFEFIMTSSEYIFRKPDRHIFELAAIKADLPAEQIWYCGNNIEADIYGAHAAGFFPVLYDDRSFKHFEGHISEDYTIPFPHLKLSSWEDMKEHLSCIESF